MKVVTGKVRLSYPNLFTPQSFNGGEPKFNANFIIPKKDKKTIAKIKEAIQVVYNENKTGKLKGTKPEKFKHPILRDGDEERPDEEAYENALFFSASGKRQPLILDEDGDEVLDQSDIYSGCYVRVSMNLFAYNSNGGKGIGAGLNAVKKVADGEPLGGASASAADFDDDFEDDDDMM